MLDEKRVREFIESNLDTIDRSRKRFDLDLDKLSELDGAEQTLKVFRTMLGQGVFDAEPTPIKDIKVRVQNIVRRNDPETSFKAAIAQTSEKRQRIYELIYLDLRNETRGLTDDGLIDTIVRIQGHKFSPSGIRTRRSEMVKAGWVRDSGKTRDSFAGHPATVWELVR